MDDAMDDPALAGLPLARADRDGDGRVAGRRELDAVFRMLDRYDGRRDGRVTRVRRGGATGATAPVDALRARGATLPESAADARHTVIVLGMSESSIAEANALRRAGAPVLLVTDGAAFSDRARGGDGRTYRLATSAGRRAFVGSLDLPPERERAVVEVLDRVVPGARREVAGLAALWTPAERPEGGVIPQRLLVSGHGDASTFFGDDHDEIRDSDIAALARAMPRAAARVEALHLASCQHGYDPRMDTFRQAFPELRSIWGYSGFSPSGAPAWHHQRVWERRTRGLPDDGGRMRPADVAGTRRAAAVSVWTRARGFDGRDTRELGIVMDELATGSGEYDAFFRGERVVHDPMRTPLAARYQLLQEVANHLDFADQDAGFRRYWSGQRDAALRLRFFTSHVTRAFDRAYGRRIGAGYRAVGLAPPRFDGMSRREALAEVGRFERALSAVPRPARAARELSVLLREGMVELSPTHVPARWL